MKAIFLICGQTGAGKSALTKRLHQHFGFPIASFGNAVRKIAQDAGEDSSDTSVLQRIGQKEVDQNPDNLCDLVLGALEGEFDGAFIDGLRHIKILEILRKKADPVPIAVIYVGLTEKIRFQRLAANRGWSLERCLAYKQSPTEVELESLLRGRTDLVVDNEGSIENSLAACVRWIDQKFRSS